MIPNPSPATLRKRRQMERRREEGRGIILLTPTGETLKALEELAELTGGSVKGEAEMVVRRAVGSALAEARKVAERIGPIYLAAQPFIRYARYLSTPGASFRVGTTVVHHSEWAPLAAQLGAFYDQARRWGWSRKRTDAFLKRAAGLPDPPAAQAALKRPRAAAAILPA